MQLKHVATIGAAYGLTGETLLFSYVEEYSSLKKYSPLQDNNGKHYNISTIRKSGKKIIARFEEIKSRTEAEQLRNTLLLAEREKLPSLAKDEFFSHDLIGFTVILENKAKYGTISNFYNFGAGNIVEINLNDSQKTVLLPFEDQYFPIIIPDNKTVTIMSPDII